jgi:hypothetical protein
MLERYHYENPYTPGGAKGGAYALYDRTRGSQHVVARTDDGDMARRLVDLLNADERLRDQAQMNRAVQNTEMSREWWCA